MLRLWPLTQRQAAAFIAAHHRHHPPSRGDIFRVGAAESPHDGGAPFLVGVAVVGRPVSREIQQREPTTAELLRLCVCERAPKNTPSLLLGAVRRAAWGLGYTRLISYTLASESGVSMRAAGYRLVGEVKGRSWDMPSRPRIDAHVIADRLLWEAAA